MDSATKRKALVALKGVVVAQPHLLLQLDDIGLFEEVMSDDAGAKMPAQESSIIHRRRKRVSDVYVTRNARFRHKRWHQRKKTGHILRSPAKTLSAHCSVVMQQSGTP